MTLQGLRRSLTSSTIKDLKKQVDRGVNILYILHKIFFFCCFFVDFCIISCVFLFSDQTQLRSSVPFGLLVAESLTPHYKEEEEEEENQKSCCGALQKVYLKAITDTASRSGISFPILNNSPFLWCPNLWCGDIACFLSIIGHAEE